MIRKEKILLLGGSGFVGINLKNKISSNYLVISPTHRQCDLLNKENIDNWLIDEDPDIIINAAALSGGIIWNQQNCDIIFHDNTIMALNLLNSAAKTHSVRKVISLISSCAYPDLDKDIVEEDMWNGEPNISIRYFGLYKRNVIAYSNALNKQFPKKKFLCPIINNMYGPYDSTDMYKTKVVMATIKKIVDAKEKNLSFVEFLGTGKPTRQFTYVGDAADAILKLVETDIDEPLINITTNEETSILELVKTVCDIIKYKGEILWDTTKTDGQMRKSMNGDRAKKLLGFEANTSLKEGLKKTIDWYLSTL